MKCDYHSSEQAIKSRLFLSSLLEVFLLSSAEGRVDLNLTPPHKAGREEGWPWCMGRKVSSSKNWAAQRFAEPGSELFAEELLFLSIILMLNLADTGFQLDESRFLGYLRTLGVCLASGGHLVLELAVRLVQPV